MQASMEEEIFSQEKDVGAGGSGETKSIYQRIYRPPPMRITDIPLRRDRLKGEKLRFDLTERLDESQQKSRKPKDDLRYDDEHRTDFLTKNLFLNTSRALALTKPYTTNQDFPPRKQRKLDLFGLGIFRGENGATVIEIPKEGEDMKKGVGLRIEKIMKEAKEAEEFERALYGELGGGKLATDINSYGVNTCRPASGIDERIGVGRRNEKIWGGEMLRGLDRDFTEERLRKINMGNSIERIGQSSLRKNARGADFDTLSSDTLEEVEMVDIESGTQSPVQQEGEIQELSTGINFSSTKEHKTDEANMKLFFNQQMDNPKRKHINEETSGEIVVRMLNSNKKQNTQTNTSFTTPEILRKRGWEGKIARIYDEEDEEIDIDMERQEGREKRTRNMPIVKAEKSQENKREKRRGNRKATVSDKHEEQ